MLRLSIHSKSFAGTAAPVLRGFTLQAGGGEFVALVGPSGCGKTTTLNIIAGLDRDFDGSVVFSPLEGEPPGRPPVLGYVFQNPRLLPWRTVRQNVALVLPRARRAGPAVDRLLASMGLTEAAGRYPGQISIGMARRVALARAFVVEPDVLLMDEPFVSLDEPTAQRLRALLVEQWSARPVTVLFVTHNLREAIQLADRLLVLAAEPARIAAEVAIPVPRGGRGDGFVEEFRARLLARPESAFRVLG